MKKSALSLTLLLLFAAATSAVAQSASSAYFFDGSFTRYRLNPALAPKSAYFGIPLLGGVSIEMNSNVGLQNFVYRSDNKDRELVTFMSGKVKREDFLAALPEVTEFGASAQVSILSAGFFAFGGFNTIDLGFNSVNSFSAPKSLFVFMKSALAEETHKVSDVKFNSLSWMDLAFGHQHRINDNLSVGARVKLLMGMDCVDAEISKIHAERELTKWSVMTHAKVRFAAPGAEFSFADGQGSEIDGVNYGSDAINGLGFGVDLGAEYDFGNLVKGLKVSAGITDLGAISWSNIMVAETKPDQKVEFDGFTTANGMAGLDDKAFSDLESDFADMAKFYDTSAKGKSSETTRLNATFRLGAEYKIPTLDWLKAGQLFTYVPSCNGFFESRTSANVAFWKMFEANLNMAVSSLETTFGTMVNFYTKGINLYAALDYVTTTLNDELLPSGDGRLLANMGIIIPVGNTKR